MCCSHAQGSITPCDSFVCWGISAFASWSCNYIGGPLVWKKKPAVSRSMDGCTAFRHRGWCLFPGALTSFIILLRTLWTSSFHRCIRVTQSAKIATMTMKSCGRQGFLAEGLQRTSAGLGSVIIDSQPITVALLANLFYDEVLTPRILIGIAAGILGLGVFLRCNHLALYAEKVQFCIFMEYHSATMEFYHSSHSLSVAGQWIRHQNSLLVCQVCLRFHRSSLGQKLLPY